MAQYDPDEALKLDNQLCFPLYAAARKITGLYTPFLKPLGLTYTQYLVMMVLWEFGCIKLDDDELVILKELLDKALGCID